LDEFFLNERCFKLVQSRQVVFVFKNLLPESEKFVKPSALIEFEADLLLLGGN